MDTAPHGIPNPADAEWRSSTYSGGTDECLERAHHALFRPGPGQQGPGPGR
ncbi:DUF397 domain-containing protein [Streptomyces sp. NPDC016626]|uniref:DUF397 domain-containing protein n=1 Tax=Streptomyces sp. NPDC016626 TaxID=3364968 RepID=UPI0037014308